jgi:hypothetical protein
MDVCEDGVSRLHSAASLVCVFCVFYTLRIIALYCDVGNCWQPHSPSKDIFTYASYLGRYGVLFAHVRLFPVTS